MNNARLPNINQLQGHMNSFIAYLVVNNRGDVLRILRENGVIMKKDPSDRELLTAIYIGIAKSRPFRTSIKKLMHDVSVEKLGLKSGTVNNFTGSVNPETIDQFVKGGATLENGFKNASGDNASEDDVESHGLSETAGNVPHSWYEIGESGATSSAPAISGTSSGTKKAFSDTAFGSFLNNLLSKENVNKAVGTGIDVLGQKLTANANQQQLDAAIRLQAAKAEEEAAKLRNNQEKSKWVMPLMIGGAIVVIGIVVTVMVMRKKKG